MPDQNVVFFVALAIVALLAMVMFSKKPEKTRNTIGIYGKKKTRWQMYKKNLAFSYFYGKRLNWLERIIARREIKRRAEANGTSSTI